ncbi:hypothetical protein BC831DRAFT_123634 [Entophlyctis helioformis]|nr:hypothetical protein BC831DRAFT_123634 [Entophlyctis helioformis]
MAGETPAEALVAETADAAARRPNMFVGAAATRRRWFPPLAFDGATSMATSAALKAPAVGAVQTPTAVQRERLAAVQQQAAGALESLAASLAARGQSSALAAVLAAHPAESSLASPGGRVHYELVVAVAALLADGLPPLDADKGRQHHDDAALAADWHRLCDAYRKNDLHLCEAAIRATAVHAIELPGLRKRLAAAQALARDLSSQTLPALRDRAAAAGRRYAKKCGEYGLQVMWTSRLTLKHSTGMRCWTRPLSTSRLGLCQH